MRARMRGPTRRPPLDRHIDFRELLGRDAWLSLPLDVQRRFRGQIPGRHTLYEGRMQVAASWAGLAIAQVCRLIGTPLAPWTGEGVATVVDVWLDEEGGLVWDRLYRFDGRGPVAVSSRKLKGPDGGLIEVVRGGLGMALTVSVEDAALHFRSRFYFIQLGALRIRLPGLLTPGKAHVIHRDEGGGRFRFVLAFDHPWLGRTLYQDGVFADPEVP